MRQHRQKHDKYVIFLTYIHLWDKLIPPWEEFIYTMEYT